ncbi:MAG: SIMPL domain-containing protein, partial [Gammaproteobacteria bacterium]
MKVVVSLILAFAAIASASIIAEGLTDLRTGDRYVTVKGVA